MENYISNYTLNSFDEAIQFHIWLSNDSVQHMNINKFVENTQFQAWYSR
jgi:hypothetical protein